MQYKIAFCLRSNIQKVKQINFDRFLRLLKHTKLFERKMSQHFRKLFLIILRQKQLEYSKTCLKRPLKKKVPIIVFQDPLSLNEGQKYCRMLRAFFKISTFIKLTCVIKIFVFFIFEWPLETGFAVFEPLRERPRLC